MFKMTSLISIFVQYIVLLNSLINATKHPCELDTEHILCERKSVNCTLAPHCTPGVEYFPLDKRQYILDILNGGRDKIARGDTKFPKAANMRALRWCFALEYYAQCYANKCVYEENSVVFKTKQYAARSIWGRKYVIGGRNSIEWLWDEFGGWFSSQEEEYPVEAIYNASDYVYHLMPLIGCAHLHSVGCGYAEGMDGDRPCNYFCCAFAGVDNELSPYPCPPGVQLYKVGEPCSQCEGSWCNNRFPNLCGQTRPINLEMGDRYRPEDRAALSVASGPAATWLLIILFLICIKFISIIQ